MKDMYSFHADQQSFEEFYQVVKVAYMQIFKRLGLVAKVTEASGGSFSEKISYEFMVLTDAGEDDIFYCDSCDYCINQEIAKVKEGDPCPKCGQPLKIARASEVGNVFDLGQKFSKAFELQFADQNAEMHYPIMGCYGIGISRCMGVIVEKSNDENGIIWPASIAPATVELVSLAGAEEQAENLYQKLLKEKVEVLWDDRAVSAGNKFAGADLLGIPLRLIVSTRNAEKIECQNRQTGQTEILSQEELLNKLAKLNKD